jgi:hypothetical protein
MDNADEVIARLRRSAESAQRVLDATSARFDGSATPELSPSEMIPGWVTRYTWKVIKGLPHPEHSFANHRTESKAIDAANSMLRNFRNSDSLELMAVHVRGPGQADWTEVE